jgi:hypothetical protein
MTFHKSKPCVKCGAPVNRAGGPRAGLTADHWSPTPFGPKKARCEGSDMPYAAQGQPVEFREVALSPFHKTLARLRGHSVTWVDFTEARIQRLLGHVTERAHALRFIRKEIRDA